MATTSMSLGPYWESFIRNQIETGRYGSASEVVRAALRALEDQNRRVEALRAHLAEGLEQSRRGEHVEDYSLTKAIADSDRDE